MLRATFIALSESRSLRGIAERSGIGQRISARFVAGKEVADAIRVAAAVNQFGAGVSIDNLGENVTNADEARASAQLYYDLLDQIAAHKLQANVSLKLTHMGLDVDENMAYEIVRGLVAKVASMSPKNFVRVDMEGSLYTQRTLDFVHELHRVPGNQGCVGAVIQSYMRRAEADIEKLLSEGIRIRLCKGAYKELEEIAFERRLDLLEKLVGSFVSFLILGCLAAHVIRPAKLRNQYVKLVGNGAGPDRKIGVGNRVFSECKDS